MNAMRLLNVYALNGGYPNAQGSEFIGNRMISESEACSAAKPSDAEFSFSVDTCAKQSRIFDRVADRGSIV
jgi:hypothetical protein